MGLHFKDLNIYRLRRIAFGVVLSSFSLTATITLHLQRKLDGAPIEENKTRAELIGRLKDQTYKDNLIVCLQEEDNIKRL